MKLISFSLALLSITLLSGCAAMKHGLGHDKYAKVPSKVSNAISRSYPQALDNSKPFHITMGETFHSSVQLNDALLKIGQDNLTYYKTFQVSGIKGKSLEFNVKSICSCFGFKKTVMPAKATILTVDGKVIQDQLIFKPQYPSYYEAEFPLENAKYDSAIILVAFNSGSKDSSRIINNITYTNSGALYLPMAIGMQNTGEILVEVSEIAP